MIKKLWAIEAIRYIVIGAMTTGVNFVSYFASREILGINMTLSILISWVLSVLFAFFTNKYFVFNSTKVSKESFIREIILFFSARVSSLGLEYLLMFLFVSQLGMVELLAKILTQFGILLANYFFSKWIFK
ncbi:GtrA family protein [Vagococcus xieshaowenii]|uniref:GtrA family protein n=1 Tax=Vagococcus xieshaowenii TaxID=2562451 RepID=A0AAJ5EFU3_9ENTE|nr:GtrA family protein [Vagococcus xieshaowenii]QCA29260.1 GtrA family protein [Vagococcus xieshaowenii]TFZ43186.1 GtrA family protein [Vagococcus xieshaowenii]